MQTQRAKDVLRTHLNFFGVFLCAFIWFQVGQSCAMANASEAKYKIAIIDTGYDSAKAKTKLKLCSSGHFDFSEGQPHERVDHGTVVAQVMAEKLVNVDYCAVIYTISKYDNAEQIISAFYKASKENVTAINASYSGGIKSVAEREALRESAKTAVVFVAAGNNGMNLDLECLAFPTCFDIPNMRPVGATDERGKRAPTSNYGLRVKDWKSGKGIRGWAFGTSFAAPRALADYILELDNTSKPTNIKLQSVKLPLPITSTRTSTTTFDN